MSVKHIGDLKKDECYGCTACQFTCPFGAISMQNDHEGFRYPVVDEEKCTGCGKCRRICPGLHDKDRSNIASPESYVIWADDKIRLDSSSGGAFTLLAKYIFSKGGVVCGVVMDEKFHVYHTFAENETELEPMRRSKYVESELGEAYPKVKKLLDEGRTVLFTGTPCQVAGLKAFLGENTKGLFTADLMCHGPTSPKVFEQYLDETFNGRENIDKFYFRSKRYGWSGTTCEVILKDGRTYMGSGVLDPFEIGSFKSLFLRQSCEDCKFAAIPKQADITIGDAWGISAYKESLNDDVGTSMILINNEKGRELFNGIKDNVKFIEKVPLDALKRNRFGAQKMKVPPHRGRFFEMINYTSVHKAVDYCMKGRYDVGIVGVWFGNNYGSIATYYGLYKQLESLGLAVLLIDNEGLGKTPADVVAKRNSRVFAREHCHVSRKYKLSEMGLLNQVCDAFVVGSDQVWNFGVARNFGRSFLLNFARPEKKKVAVACSFGHKRDYRSDRERIITSDLLKKFDAISVREESAVDILDNVFGVNSTRVLDPVFSTDRKVYDDVAKESQRSEKEPYLLAYILDPTPEKREAVKHLAEKKGLKAVFILDGETGTFKKNKEKMGDEKVLENVTFPDWVAYFKNSSYVVTYSCHGMSFAILYEKPFAGIGNEARGMVRSESLVKLFHLEDRLVKNSKNIINNGTLLKDIDYASVNEILESERERSRKWLEHAMFSEKVVKTYQAYPVRVEADQEKELVVTKEEIEQVKPTFWRGLLYRLPIGMQKKAKKMAKNYVTQKEEKNV